MDFYIIFLINSLASFSSLKAIDVAASFESLSWQDAADNDQNDLLDLEYVSKHGWDSLSGIDFGREGLWVAARAKLAPTVSWEGCARSKPDCVSELITAGSLGDCLQNCQSDSKYMLLKGDKCRCFKKKDEACVQRTTDNCNDQCRINPNDWCGGNFGAEALYRTGPLGNYTDTSNESILCIVLKIDSDSNKTFSGENCNSLTRRSICKSKDSEDVFVASTATALRNWFESLGVCKESNAYPYFDIQTNKSIEKRKTYWTSLRRGLIIKWTKSDTDYPLCVSARLNMQSRLMLNAEECNMRKRYLFLTGRRGDTPDEDRAWLIAILVFLAVCLPSVGLACYISGRRRSREKLDLPPVRFKVQRRQSPTRTLSSQLSQRPPIRRPDNMTIECDYDYVTVSDTDFCFDEKLRKLEPPYSTNRRFQNCTDSLYDNKTLPRGHCDNFLSPNLYNTIECGYGRNSKRVSIKPLLDDQRSHSLDRKSSNKSSAKNFFPYELDKY